MQIGAKGQLHGAAGTADDAWHPDTSAPTKLKVTEAGQGAATYHLKIGNNFWASSDGQRCSITATNHEPYDASRYWVR
jgi:hypothetical protein